MSWWNEIPWRMIQTNLRETDMEDISAKRFAADLKAFGATVALLNTGGIIASYDTALDCHFQSEYLHGDSLRDIVDSLHQEGIRVIARMDFSKVRRKLYEKHPEWAYRTAEGAIIDYNGDVHVCLNGEYQQKRMFEIVTEAIERTGMDGIFCNMSGFHSRDYSYNEYGPCHCGACRALFKEQYGLPLPRGGNWDDPSYRQYKLFQQECAARHSRRLYEHIKAISPELAVNGYDIERMESNTEYGRPLPHWQYSASSNTRVIRGAGERAVTASNCTVDFIGFYYRHVAVSPRMQELRLWQNLANLGGLDYYIIGRIDNHEDRSGFEPVKKAFGFHKKHEALFHGLKSRAEALLIRAELNVNTSEERGWIRALTESHILFDEIRVWQAVEAPLQKYKAIILPDLRFLPKALAKRLDEFAHAGGVVVSAGRPAMRGEPYETHGQPLLECLGVNKIKFIREDMVSALLKITERGRKPFSRYKASDLIAIGDMFIYAGLSAGSEGWLSLIPPHHYGPPERCYYTQVTDIPGISRYTYGEGYGVFIPWLPGKLFHEGGYENSLLFLQSTFDICGLTDTAPALSPMVEVSVSEKPGMAVVQLVNASGHFGVSFYSPIPVRNARVAIDSASPPVRASALRGKAPDYSMDNNRLQITIPELNEYEAIVIEY